MADLFRLGAIVVVAAILILWVLSAVGLIHGTP
jgi:hypothetical protein